MAKITSKLQVTIPRKLADTYGLAPGDEVEFVPAGEGIRLVTPRQHATGRLLSRSGCGDSASAGLDSESARNSWSSHPIRLPGATGRERTCIPVANLVDTNVLVYSFDPRDPAKQRKADELLLAGLRDDSIVLAH